MNESDILEAIAGRNSQESGKSLRKKAPRKSHGDWRPVPDRPDPLSLLHAQDEDRLEHLLPIKYGRMMASPFAFLRGSAVVMAADLAQSPVSGLQVILCGDAHLSNFGIFASPERRLIFDLNDFDETHPGPWEWDLKRLAASAVVAGRENGFSEQENRSLVHNVVRTYDQTMSIFSGMHVLDVWYYHVLAEQFLPILDRVSQQGRKRKQKTIRKAARKTHQQTLEKLTKFEYGERRIISDPPLLVPTREINFGPLAKLQDLGQIRDQIDSAWVEYLESLPPERQFLLQNFKIVDKALRVGGVGSVGTQCFIVLVESQHEDDALILQLKEAGPSVLTSYLPPFNFEHQGRRVVIGQRLMQATTDIFLGWHTSQISGRRFYWRQLKDLKGSADISVMDYETIDAYLMMCAKCLARAHARTGNEAKIHAYIGRDASFEEAIGKFAIAYADQTEQDYQALVNAVKSGRIEAETGV